MPTSTSVAPYFYRAVKVNSHTGNQMLTLKPEIFQRVNLDCPRPLDGLLESLEFLRLKKCYCRSISSLDKKCTITELHCAVQFIHH